MTLVAINYILDKDIKMHLSWLTSSEHCEFCRQLGLLRFSSSQSISDSYAARYAETHRKLIKKVTC